MLLIDIWSTSLRFDIDTSPVFVLFCNCLMFMYCSGWHIFLTWLVMVDLGILYLDFIYSYNAFINTMATHIIIISQSVYNWLPCFTDSISLDHLVILILLIVSSSGFCYFLILICWWDSNSVNRYLIILDWNL